MRKIESQQAIIEADIERGLGKAIPIFRLSEDGSRLETDPILIDISFRHFLTHSMKNGLFERLVADEIKKPEIDAEHLRVSVHTGFGNVDEARMLRFLQLVNLPQFFLDGFHGLILSDATNGYGVCASFESLRRLEGNLVLSEKHPSHPDFAKDIVVLQLQGPLKSWVQMRNEIGMPSSSELIENIRWPFLLLDLICIWAKQAGLQRIFLLPAEMNDYCYSGTSRFEQMKMRYNVTGTRLGFEPHESGLLVRDFAQLTAE